MVGLRLRPRRMCLKTDARREVGENFRFSVEISLVDKFTVEDAFVNRDTRNFIYD